jgi:copper(I)-binding protein
MKLTLQSLLASMLMIFSGLVIAESITVENPYVRAIPPGQTISASFLTLKNSSDKDIDLVKATSDIAENVELHEHVHENGMMKMRQVPKISIAAKSTTELKPGGYHIMLIGLKKAIQPKDIIDINLQFSDGSQQAIKAEVKKIAMGMMKKKMGGMAGEGAMKGMKGMKKGGDMAAKMRHVNPMPPLMQVIVKKGDQLNLTEKQAAELKQWRDDRMPVSKKLVDTIIKLEADLHTAAIEGESLEKIDQLADAIMQNRVKMIRGKALCRDNMKRILDNEQYSKVIELYKAGL